MAATHTIYIYKGTMVIATHQPRSSVYGSIAHSHNKRVLASTVCFTVTCVRLCTCEVKVNWAEGCRYWWCNGIGWWIT